MQGVHAKCILESPGYFMFVCLFLSLHFQLCDAAREDWERLLHVNSFFLVIEWLLLLEGDTSEDDVSIVS